MPSSLRPRGQKHSRGEDIDSDGEVSPSNLKLPKKRTRSGPARSRSPGDCLSLLELDEQGICFRELNELYKSGGPCREFVQRIANSTHKCQGIFPPSFSSVLREQGSTLHWAPEDFGSDHLFSSDRDGLGHTPLPKRVAKILKAAAEVSKNRHDEISWNSELHHRILKVALRPHKLETEGFLTNFLSCSSASIIPEYYPPDIPGRKVDFAVYIDPTKAPGKKEAITKLRRKLPKRVINHTDHYALRHRPIAFSIETKLTGEEWQMGKLQLGTWLSAQWWFLQHLLELRQKAMLHDSDASVHRQCLPAFLPGIIIQGHDWHLVLSTREKQQTIIWEKSLIGSSSDALGVYKLICGLQLLRQWAQDTYWPWLQEVIGV